MRFLLEMFPSRLRSGHPYQEQWCATIRLRKATPSVSLDRCGHKKAVVFCAPTTAQEHFVVYFSRTTTMRATPPLFSPRK